MELSRRNMLAGAGAIAAATAAKGALAQDFLTSKRFPDPRIEFLDPRFTPLVGSQTAPGTPQDFAKFIAAETGKWRDIAKVAGVAAE